MAFSRPPKKNQPKEPKEFQEEVIQIDRVTRVVKGGRRLRFRATVVIGNLKGKVGVGVGKSNEVVNAIQKGISKAKKNLISVNIYKETIPHEIKVKYKTAKLIMLPASLGTGLISGGSVRKVIELAGIKNIITKCLGASNRINNAKATILALEKLKKREEKKTQPEKTQQEQEAEKNSKSKITT
ncbi:30S ribosomal protein S5 [Candidatus Peregrinibacteria bacterium]|nr:30S ribosomal protein S5 [Candidatus Peregrinibacteria bacterium]